MSLSKHDNYLDQLNIHLIIIIYFHTQKFSVIKFSPSKSSKKVIVETYYQEKFLILKINLIKPFI